MDYDFGIQDAKVFMETLADTLAVNRDYIREGYEDILYYLHKEQRLPLITINADAKNYAQPSFPSGIPVPAGAVDLMGRIFREFT